MNQYNRTQRRFTAIIFTLWRPTPFFIVAMLLFACLPHVACADAIGDISFHLSTDRSEDAAGTAVSERHFRLNLATGWSQLMTAEGRVGYGLSFRTERGLQNGSELAGYGVGVFIGWYQGPLSLRLDYVALSELKSNSGITETAFREGSGFSFQARWIYWFGDEATKDSARRVGFGPSIAFEQIKYAKSRVGTLPETSATRVTEALMPGFAGVFLF